MLDGHFVAIFYPQSTVSSMCRFVNEFRGPSLLASNLGPDLSGWDQLNDKSF